MGNSDGQARSWELTMRNTMQMCRVDIRGMPGIQPKAAWVRLEYYIDIKIRRTFLGAPVLTW